MWRKPKCRQLTVKPPRQLDLAPTKSHCRRQQRIEIANLALWAGQRDLSNLLRLDLPQMLARFRLSCKREKNVVSITGHCEKERKTAGIANLHPRRMNHCHPPVASASERLFSVCFCPSCAVAPCVQAQPHVACSHSVKPFRCYVP